MSGRPLVHVATFTCFDDMCVGRVVTHHGFVKDKAECAQRKNTESELDRLKEVARVWWKAFNEGQKDRLVRWQVEKTCLVTLKEKGQPRPSMMLMRDWMTKNYPQLRL